MIKKNKQNGQAGDPKLPVTARIVRVKPYVKNTMRAFIDIQMMDVLLAHGASIHEKNGKRWVSWPASERQKDGGRTWQIVLEFSGSRSLMFQEEILRAYDEFIGELQNSH